MGMPARWRCGSTSDDDAHAKSAMTRERTAKRKGNRLVAVTLDEASIGRSNPDVEHERAVAIYDLLEDNVFAPSDDDGALCIASEHHRQSPDVRYPARERHAGDGAPAFAVAAAANREGLLHRLRQLLRGHSHRHTRSHRGARHGPARAPRRGLQHPDGAARAQGDYRFRHCPPTVQADAACCIGRDGARRRTCDRRPCCSSTRLDAVRWPMAAALLKQCLAASLRRIRRRAKRRASMGSRSPPWTRSASTSGRIGQITFEELDELEGLDCDLIVALSPEGHHKALELTRSFAVEVDTGRPPILLGRRQSRAEDRSLSCSSRATRSTNPPPVVIRSRSNELRKGSNGPCTHAPVS